MKHALLRLGMLIVFVAPLFAQQEKPGFGITFSGYVKTDAMFDTRQTTSAREGHFFLYPAPEVLDKNGADINAAPGFNILSIQTRLTGKITAPDAFGAKTSGQMEAEFFGTTDGDINGFRLRHAFLKLDWAHTSLLVGQTWHPMFILEMFPGVVSFNTGVPFQAFARAPQIRLAYTTGDVKFTLAAASQRDFQSNGPAGLSSAYLRNSVIPDLHAQVSYASGGHLAGAALDYKKLTPRIVTTKNVKTDAFVDGIAALGFVKVNADPVTIKAQALYGQNTPDLMQIGGYAVTSTDPVTGIEAYTALTTFSAWAEVSIGKQIEYALFAGYSKALGADENVTGPYYGRATDIGDLYRIAPRIQFNAEKTRISAEVEYTAAGYGTPDGANKGKVGNIRTVANTRLLVAFYYFF